MCLCFCLKESFPKAIEAMFTAYTVTEGIKIIQFPRDISTFWAFHGLMMLTFARQKLRTQAIF